MVERSRPQLLMEVCNHRFAADARDAREVLETVAATPIPGSAPGVLGLINDRGAVIVAGDLATLLGLPAGRTGEAAHVVLESDGRCLALRVDRVIGVIPALDEEQEIDGALLEALGSAELTAGVARFESLPCYRLDVSALFDRVLGDEPAEAHPR